MKIIKRFNPFYKKYDTYTREDNWEEIRKKILERDKMACIFCGGYEQLAVHHIDMTGHLPNYEKPNNDENNLVTVCVHCHGKMHKRILKKYALEYESY